MPLHLGVTIGLPSGVSVVLLALLPSGPFPWTAWAVAGAALLLADFVEYALHRWPMHRRRRLTRTFFRHHTIDHHRSFTHEEMDIQTLREVSAVIPSAPVLFVSLTLLGLLTGLLSLAFGAHTGMFTGAMLGLFGAGKQLLHLAFHLPEGWMRLPVLRGRVFQAMRTHHAIHHDPRLMRKWNFNLGTPLFDALFGTLTWQR